MIERLLLRENLSFDHAKLDLKPGLIVFTGASGAGKSVLMEAILGLFGIKDIQGALVESVIDIAIDLESYGLESDEILILRAIKKEKVRYFLNDQAVSKKQVKEICARFIRYISQKEKNDFENSRLLGLLDEMASVKDSSHTGVLQQYGQSFEAFQEIRKKLDVICEEERKVEELKEFAQFEIQKISQINPEEGEYDRLMEIKKRLSQKEKIESKLGEAQRIFECEHAVYEALELLDIKSEFLEDALQQLRYELDSASDAFTELEEVNIEEVLDRIEQLSSLKRKYGSVEEALEYKAAKQKELEHYENLSFEKSTLEKQLQECQKRIEKEVNTLSANRTKMLTSLESEMNGTLKNLNLSNCTVQIEEKEMDSSGKDSVILKLNGTALESVSSGEFNRLRLALLSVRSNHMKESGILILDEIDANLSGEESEGVAKVLKTLARTFQVFSISHQPHICVLSDQHFLVSKEEGQSQVREISGEERELEVARMISGSKITQEARDFAKRALFG